ncbi:hypothetical protein SAMN05421820_11140 [Pedobacter steynii]|uniref:Uncharacterized protein n=1 Tax=Pedobacter steynii TaxID=430522 RepID=A0A1H0G4S5_9SPHI|nr:hypothetical protein [Pedobacter steynii]NQX42320.1 hypothetical protein [Pedobacter steynii]SDO01841.1 hypothetical protein SAMN05421820_11140 [Pedobacter steynii]
MSTTEPNPETSDIPRKIFTHFIEELKTSEIPLSIIEQLEKTILTEGNFTEQALRAALTINTEV